MNHLDDLIAAQKRGESKGMVSICSAHPWVLQAAMQSALQTGEPVLIEATCNQVNQFGGYTGMTPPDFVRFVDSLAAENSFPKERMILGGDHLGPTAWQNEPAASAMQKSIEMVRAYVRAGFVKIHLDASMKLADDPDGPFPLEVSARRAAVLAQAAEDARSLYSPAPRYVIGSEVPVAGGAKTHEYGVNLTTVESARQTIDVTRQAFLRLGLESAWERVIAVVVQPGVEFGDDFVLAYHSEAGRDLSRFIESQPHLVYEVHSTDYQARQALCDLVRDHFAVLKVGPGLTFAFREAVFALAAMENELFPASERSQIVAVLDQIMLRHPEHWRKYYHGSPEQQAFARKYSLSDRVRYYWPHPKVQHALRQLMTNLAAIRPLPHSLLSQFLPMQYHRIRQGVLQNIPQAILSDKIMAVLGDYTAACRNSSPQESLRPLKT
jgi:D-tagatose-1,6-bisphosphate aldolase subunit GatZ/KbaZ